MTRAMHFLCGVICALGILSDRAQADQILVTQPVPDLPKLRWIKGTPIESWEKDTTYVLVFTATWWRGKTMEKVMSLAEEVTRHFGQYDVQLHVVALAFHHTQFPIESSEFRKMWGPEISFDIGVAHDNDAEQHLWAYLRKCGADAVPHIVVVDHKGQLAWTLGPGSDQIIPKMPLLTLVLEDLLAGEFDLLKEPGVLRRSGRKLPPLRDELRRLRRDLAVKQFAGKWDEVVGILDELTRADPGQADEYAVQKFDAALLAGRPPDEIHRLALAVAQGAADQKEVLVTLASKVVPIACRQRDYLRLATSLVKAAWPEPGRQAEDPESIDALVAKVRKLCGERDAAALELLATLHRLKGDADAAFAEQLKAYFLVNDAAERARLRVGLRRYKEESERVQRVSVGESATQ